MGIPLLRKVLILFAVVTAALDGAPAMANVDPRCARLEQRQGYGPYDYRARRGKTRENLKIVESFHLSSSRQNSALRGEPKTINWWDLDYTLRAFPNHSRALYLLGLFAHLLQRDHPAFYRMLEGTENFSPASCYFHRAARYAPDDPNVWTSLGRLQTTMTQYEEAISSFKRAVELAPRSGAAHYNLGLAYFAAEKFLEASNAARKAISLGHKRQDLRHRLVSKGKWE